MTTTDLLVLATAALASRDAGALFDLQDTVRGWLCSEAERDALVSLLGEMAEAVELLDD